MKTALAVACAAGIAVSASGFPVPRWTAPRGDPSKPLGGWKPVPGATYSIVYNATPAIGTYNHEAIVTYGAEAGQPPQLLVTWKNSPRDEDSPGQRVLYAQSFDGGASWFPAIDGVHNVLMPNMSTSSNPAALFTGPSAWLNGRLYAAASPTQFSLYPDQYPSVLLLRRVYTNTTGLLGPPFWASATIPPGFEEASALNNVVTVTQMDAQTQADVALLTPTALTLPCDVPGNVTTKCEACAGGCQPWSVAFQVKGILNERCHYTLPNASPAGADVLLYRNSSGLLYASVRNGTSQDGWSFPAATDMPNDESNINAGSLPDGRRYFLSNAMPYTIRDPLTIATSADGLAWDTCAVVMTCTALPGDGCGPRFPGKYKNPGPSYPQGAVAADKGVMYVVATNNKENVWLATLPLDAL